MAAKTIYGCNKASRTLLLLHQEWSLCLLPRELREPWWLPWLIKWKWCYVIPKLAHFWVVLLGNLLLDSNCHTIRKLKQPEEEEEMKPEAFSSSWTSHMSVRTQSRECAMFKKILAVLHSMWDISSPTRDLPSIPCIASAILTAGWPGKSPKVPSWKQVMPCGAEYCHYLPWIAVLWAKWIAVVLSQQVLGVICYAAIDNCDTHKKPSSYQLSLGLCKELVPGSRPRLSH